MCGRFSLFVPQPDVERRFEASATRPLGERYNIAPRTDVPVVRADEPDVIDQIRWGLRPGWVDDPGEWPHPINARAETVEEKPSFREAAAERRCLVLADGYYEWTGTRGSKQPYRIAMGGEPFAFAGLWDAWRSNGDALRTVAIVTTAANETVGEVHDRMPVVLEPDEEAAWLAADDPDERAALLDPYPDDGGLEVYPVSRAVNDPANDRPSLVEPIDIGEQAGLEEFA
ncbi:MAG: SOS response-associated peptidase [Halobacteriales archaeon]|nr:SOS response-associated peptidase [Halobacteriales archaeon]